MRENQLANVLTVSSRSRTNSGPTFSPTSYHCRCCLLQYALQCEFCLRALFCPVSHSTSLSLLWFPNLPLEQYVEANQQRHGSASAASVASWFTGWEIQFHLVYGEYNPGFGGKANIIRLTGEELTPPSPLPCHGGNSCALSWIP